MTDAEIAEVACLIMALDASPDDEGLVRRVDDRLKQCASVVEGALVMLAHKLLCGRPYGVSSDNPESIRRYRSMAMHLGATITEADEGAGMTSLRFDPATRN
jgi:putative intracellular protease/amidase